MIKNRKAEFDRKAEYLFIYLFTWRESKGTFKSGGERGTRSNKCEWLYVLHNYLKF